MKILSTSAALTLALAMAQPAAAQAPAEFFKGKTLTIYVGLSAGGGYDMNARLLSRHFGKYIPGNPTVVVRNMPGAGGLVMTNHVANVSPKDGLHLGAPQRGVPFEPLLGQDSIARQEVDTQAALVKQLEAAVVISKANESTARAA